MILFVASQPTYCFKTDDTPKSSTGTPLLSAGVFIGPARISSL